MPAPAGESSDYRSHVPGRKSQDSARSKKPRGVPQVAGRIGRVLDVIPHRDDIEAFRFELDVVKRCFVDSQAKPSRVRDHAVGHLHPFDVPAHPTRLVEEEPGGAAYVEQTAPRRMPVKEAESGLRIRSVIGLLAQVVRVTLTVRFSGRSREVRRSIDLEQPLRGRQLSPEQDSAIGALDDFISVLDPASVTLSVNRAAADIAAEEVLRFAGSAQVPSVRVGASVLRPRTAIVGWKSAMPG